MVYVDGLLDRGWRLGPSCHLLADSEGELHAFAAKIGLKRRWAQMSRSGVVHYDLTGPRRADAVRLGACEDEGAILGLLRRLKAPRVTKRNGR